MNSSEDFRKGRMGSFELAPKVGSNLLLGLLVATLIHEGIVATPIVLQEFFGIWTVDEVTVYSREQGQERTQIMPRIDVHPRPPRPLPPQPKPDLKKKWIAQIVEEEQVDTSKVVSAPAPVDDWNPIEGGPVDSVDFPGGVDRAVTDLFRPEETIPAPDIYIVREVEPRALSSNAQPVFPEMAKMAKVGGVVHVNLYVDRHGEVRDYRIVKVKPKDLGFDEEVLKVVPRWKFTPALQQNRPVGVWVTIPVRFDIK